LFVKTSQAKLLRVSIKPQHSYKSSSLADKPGLVARCAFPSSDRTGQSTSLLVSRSPYRGGNDSHPPPSALYKAIRFVVTAVWLCAKRSSLP
jgi:hypothetical protein